jgi:hypothetical protein
LNFLEIDMRDHVPLYRRGVERVTARDAYAGLLVSLHWTGLYRGRWGLQTGGVFRTGAGGPAARLQDEAVEEQEVQWIAIKRKLTVAEPRSDLEIGLWHNYELLQAFDLLSLYLCTANLGAPAGAQPQLLTDVLSAIEQQPGGRVIGAVPLRAGAERVDLLLEPTGDGRVVIDPYPFAEDPVELAVSGRRIPARRYSSPGEVSDALAHAEEVTLAFTLGSRDAIAAGEGRREVATW